jgi:hypothetical protein
MKHVRWLHVGLVHVAALPCAAACSVPYWLSSRLAR